MIDASVIKKQIDYGWTEIVVHSSIDEDMVTNANIAWNVGRCSFVATKLSASLVQHFKIPRQYQSANHSPHSWHLTTFCGKLIDVDVKISLSLQERNNRNETLQTYTFGESIIPWKANEIITTSEAPIILIRMRTTILAC